MIVLEELDKFKKNQDELGRNARQVSRKLDKIVKKSKLGSIADSSNPKSMGVELKNSGRILIELNHVETLTSFDSKVNDNKILSTAKHYTNEFPDSSVVLLSKDSNLRIKANTVGVKSEDYESDRSFTVEETYSGYRTIEVTEKQFHALNDDAHIQLKDKMFPNEYAIITCKSLGAEISTVVKYVEINNRCELLKGSNNAFGIEPKNVEQQIAIDLLLDPNVPLVTITGKAGTGKTLLAVAAGLQQTLENNSYSRMLIARPIVPMGNDIGYLPGTLEEKLNPWMQPIFDNLEYIFDAGKLRKGRSNKEEYERLIEQGVIQIEPLTYIRGRSIPNQFIIIDESQNLTKHELRTILSRVGDNTKIILTGDPDQIDSPYIDKVSCGLSQVVDKFKESPLAGHISLKKGERSGLAEAVVEILK